MTPLVISDHGQEISVAEAGSLNKIQLNYNVLPGVFIPGEQRRKRIRFPSIIFYGGNNL